MPHDDLLRLAHTTQDGVVVDLGRTPARGGEHFGLVGALAWLAVGPLTLALLALPGAALVEWAGWWLVNEGVLAWRWLGYGALVWVAALLVAWVGWLAPSMLRVEITPRVLSVIQERCGFGVRRARIPMECVFEVEARRALTHDRVIVRHAEGTLRLPVDPELPYGGVVALINELAEEARGARMYGGPDEVPAALRRLIERR